MLKMAMIIWIMAGAVFAGLAVLVVLAIPSLSDQAITLIGPLASAGFVVAIPIAYLVAKRMGSVVRH